MSMVNKVENTPKGYFLYFDYCVVAIAIVVNIFMLVAVIRARITLVGYKLFLISLTTSDIYVCLVNIFSMIYQAITQQKFVRDRVSSFILCGAKTLRTLQLAGFFASLLNIVGMSFDHFFGVAYPMQYRAIMSMRKVRIVVFIIWIVSFSLAFLDIPINIIIFKQQQGNKEAMAPVPRRVVRDGEGFSTLSGDNSDVTLPTYEDFNPFDSFFEDLKNYGNNFQSIENNSMAPRPRKNGTLSLIEIVEMLREEERAAAEMADMCSFFSLSKMWFEICVVVLVMICFLVLIMVYSVILRKVSNRMATGKSQTNKKLIITTVILLGAFVIWFVQTCCYISC